MTSFDPGGDALGGGGLVAAGGSDNSTMIPLNEDGTPNYGSILPTASSVPVDASGAIDVWNLPSWVYDYEKQVPKPIYWTGNPSAGAGQDTGIAPGFNNRAFRKANDLPEQIEKPQGFDLNISAEDLMKQFAAMDPAQLQPLQALLGNGPWGATSTYTPSGTFDPTTERMLATAISQYLKVSRGAGKAISFMSFLTSAAQTNTANGGGLAGGGVKPRQISLTDPNDIRAAAQQAAQASLGHTFTPKQLNAFVDQFHAAQTAAQTSTDASVTTPDLSSEALAEAQSGGNAQEFANHQAQGYMDTFIDMFAPSGSQSGGVRPVTPVV